MTKVIYNVTSPWSFISTWFLVFPLSCIESPCKCVCVCVCVRERERERETDRQRERLKTVLIPAFDILKFVFLKNTLRCVNTLLLYVYSVRCKVECYCNLNWR